MGNPQFAASHRELGKLFNIERTTKSRKESKDNKIKN